MWGMDALRLEAKAYPSRRKGQESQLVHFNLQKEMVSPLLAWGSGIFRRVHPSSMPPHHSLFKSVIRQPFVETCYMQKEKRVEEDEMVRYHH